MASILLEIALEEKLPEDILRWHDYSLERERYYRLDERVAEAIEKTHPERSLEMQREMAEKRIAETNPSAYERAVQHLRKVRKLMHRLNRKREWNLYIEQLRVSNKRKRRFLEALDRLNNKRIIDS